MQVVLEAASQSRQVDAMRSALLVLSDKQRSELLAAAVAYLETQASGLSAFHHVSLASGPCLVCLPFVLAALKNAAFNVGFAHALGQRHGQPRHA